MKRNRKKIILCFILILILIHSRAIFAQNQQNYSDIIITWRAHNYTPNNYLNKNLPTQNSLIELNLILIKNNKLIDLNKYFVSWYLDNNLIEENYNLKKTFFKINKPTYGVHFITAKAVNEETLEEFKKTIALDIFSPRIGLEIKSSKNNLFLKALPYFFNIEDINDLNFNWQINDKFFQTQGDNELILKNINEKINKIMLNVINTRFSESAIINKNL